MHKGHLYTFNLNYVFSQLLYWVFTAFLDSWFLGIYILGLFLAYPWYAYICNTLCIYYVHIYIFSPSLYFIFLLMEFSTCFLFINTKDLFFIIFLWSNLSIFCLLYMNLEFWLGLGHIQIIKELYDLSDIVL